MLDTFMTLLTLRLHMVCFAAEAFMSIWVVAVLHASVRRIVVFRAGDIFRSMNTSFWVRIYRSFQIDDIRGEHRNPSHIVRCHGDPPSGSRRAQCVCATCGGVMSSAAP